MKTCQYTGLPFEGSPQANKARCYTAMQELLATLREQDGLTIEMVEAAGQELLRQPSPNAAASFAARRAAEKDERKERRRLNDLLGRHGYKWADTGFADEEAADFHRGWPSAVIGTQWHLYGPDGETTVLQALKAIAASLFDDHPDRRQAERLLTQG